MNKRDINRWFCAILYEEDNNFNKYFNNIKELYEKVTWIRHDRDIMEDGTPKKKHIHILFNVGENARYRRSIAKEIGIAENYLEGCNKKNMLKYLIHYNKQDKTQYKIEEVKGELKEELKKIINRESETMEERLKELIERVNKGKILSIYALLNYAIENDMMEIVKKNQLLICKLIEEEQKIRKNQLTRTLHKM